MHSIRSLFIFQLRSLSRAPSSSYWRSGASNRFLQPVAYYNLLGAALTLPLAIATGLGAWQWQLEGATLKGNLLLHMICALTSAALILSLCWKRSRIRAKGESPRPSYFVVMALGLMMITLTGHLGGILSGVETP